MTQITEQPYKNYKNTVNYTLLCYNYFINLEIRKSINATNEDILNVGENGQIAHENATVHFDK